MLIDAATTPVTLAEVKAHLRIDPADTSQDDELTLFINAATKFGEKYTGREFINKTFRTFRDCFDPCGFEIRRSRLQSVIDIKYLDSDSVQQTVDSSGYFNTFSNDFAEIKLNPAQQWPSDVLDRVQAIEIEFVAGYGATSADVPDSIRSALLNHIGALYANRGDCDDGTCDCAGTLPSESKGIYDICRIIDISNC